MRILVNNNGVARLCYNEGEVRLMLHQKEIGKYFNYLEFKRKFKELISNQIYNAPMVICGCEITLLQPTYILGV